MTTGRWHADRIGPYAALAVTCLLGWAFKGHCGAFWSNGIQYVTGCYSDAVPFWGLRGVADGQLPYLQARLEYPVLTGLVIWIEGGLARLVAGQGADAATFLAVVAAVNASFAAAVLALLRRMDVPLARQYGWACAPALILYLGHNWDLLAITLALASVALAMAGRAGGAVALAALGVSAKLFPIWLLPLFGLHALLVPGGLDQRLGRAARLVAISLLAWGALNLPVALAAPEAWLEFYVFSSARSGTAAATFDVLATLGWWASDVPLRNWVSAVTFLGGGAVIVAVAWRRHGDTPWTIFTPLLAWFLMTSKVWSPQFDLWLWPFLILTIRNPVPIIAFALADIACYFAEFWMFAGMEGLIPSAAPRTVAVVAMARLAVMAWLIADAVLRDPPGWCRSRARATA